jgi:monofunctional glycosyltransferase
MLKKILLLMAAGLVLFLVWNLVWPPVAPLAEHNPETSAIMELQRQTWREQGVKRRIRQYWRPLSQISPYLVQAVLIAEDDKFYSHSGFDLEMIEKAFQRNLDAGEIKYGASTITQQVAKNLFLSNSRNFLRKAREAIIAWRLELHLDKDRILELYLNLVEWGPGVYGAQAAARHHFHCPASQLTPLQAARLAAVLPSPSRYNPAAPSKYVAKRANRILREMKRRGLGKIWR